MSQHLTYVQLLFIPQHQGHALQVGFIHIGPRAEFVHPLLLIAGHLLFKIRDGLSFSLSLCKDQCVDGLDTFW